MRYRLTQIGNGETGTDQTVKALAELVTQSLQRPYIRLLALRILERANASSRDPLQAAQAIFAWVKQFIRYVNDPLILETIQDPQVTAKLKAGDCDDHAGLVAALALAIGLPARFVVIGPHADYFQHIYTEINCRGKWVPADTASTLPFGSAKNLGMKKNYNFKGDPTMNIGRLGAAEEYLPITKGDVKSAAYNAAFAQLKMNWNNGLINQNDIKGYLRVIDEGNSPFRGSIVEATVRQSISDFLGIVTGNDMQSFKPAGTMSGLEGLDGFLKSIFKAVTGAVGSVVKAVTGGGGSVTVKLPSVTAPSVTTTASPQTIMNTASDFITSPIGLAAIGLAAILLLRK